MKIQTLLVAVILIANLSITIVNAQKLYYVDRHSFSLFSADGEIHRVNLDGTEDELLINTQSGLGWGIALDPQAGKMYWVESRTDKIRRANLNGSNLEDLIDTGLNFPIGFALDVNAGKMYWSELHSGKISRANLDGSNIEALISSGVVRPYSLALDLVAGKMYWAEQTENAKIQRANLDGSAIENLPIAGLEGPNYIALDIDAGKIYWSVHYYTIKKIQRANLDGSNVEDIILSLDKPRGIAIDKPAGLLYFGDGNSIRRANLDGSDVQSLGNGSEFPQGIALDLTPCGGLDCQPNGTPDGCDIHHGYSADCNMNEVPDECDIATGFGLDCNMNEVPDDCDIALGSSTDDVPIGGDGIPDDCQDDCNFNNVLDDIDINTGTSEDCDENGIPDECQWDLVVAGLYPLNTNHATDSGSDSYARIATDGQGNWVAVWLSRDDLGGTIGIDHDVLFARSTDNGVTWTDPLPLNSYAATDTGEDWVADLATNGQGTWLVVWGSEENIGGAIGTDRDIVISRSTDNGATWTSPEPLNSNAQDDSDDEWGPSLATDGANNWVAAWSYGQVAHSGDNGATWSELIRPGGGRDTVVAMDQSGHCVFVSQIFDRASYEWDILFSTSDDYGVTWSAASFLNNNAVWDTGHDLDPWVVTDGQGIWLAAWHSYDDLGGTIGTDTDILYARSFDNGATWSDPAPLNNDASYDSDQDGGVPHITTDGNGHWAAVWSSGGIVLATSTDNGATWSDPLLIGSGYAPQTVTDGQNTWLASFGSRYDSSGNLQDDTDILVARLFLVDDCNFNGMPDSCEIADQLVQDCNGNVVPDKCDLELGASQDCNDNSTPDECEDMTADCNDNNVWDACDLSTQTSVDCNGNAVPDECDVAEGTSQDCNGNNIPDECEQDVDQDGVIDDCDLCPGFNDIVFGPDCIDAIPTVSTWGLTILTLLLLTTGKLYFRRCSNLLV